MNQPSSSLPAGKAPAVAPALLERHEAGLRMYLRGLPGAEPGRVETVVREVIQEAAGQRDFEEEPVVWLFAQGRRRVMGAGHRGDVLVADDTAGMTEDEIAAGEDPRIAVHRTFGRLTVKQQEVLRLKFQFGFSLPELAAVLGVNPGGAGGLLHSGVMRICQALGAPLSLGAEWTRNGRLTAYALDEMEPGEKKAFAESVPDGKALLESADAIRQTGVQIARVLESGAPLPRRRRKGAGGWKSRYAWLLGAVAVAGAIVTWYVNRDADDADSGRFDVESRMNGSFATPTGTRRDETAGSGRSGDHALSPDVWSGNGRSLRPGEADWERKAFGQGQRGSAGEPGSDPETAPSEAHGRGEAGPSSDNGGTRSAGGARGASANTAPAAENRGESAPTGDVADAEPTAAETAAETEPSQSPAEASGRVATSNSGKKVGGGQMKPMEPETPDPAKAPPGSTEAGKAQPPPVPALGIADVGRVLAQKRWPKPAEVPVAEMVKRTPAMEGSPATDEALAAQLEMARSPWRPEKVLARVTLKARPTPAPTRTPANLVFAIDVSQSMAGPNRLPLVQEGIRLLAERLRPEDRVTVVTYAASAKELLPGSPLGEKALELRNCLGGLEAAGLTNGYEGLQLAYRAARAGRVEGGLNVVVLCTDGNFNLGETNEAVLAGIAAQAASEGIKLSIFGFGRSDRNDLRLELLAAKGGGGSCYVNTREEAERLLITQIDGLVEAAANEVSFAVKFNPASIAQAGRVDGGTEGEVSGAVAELLPGRTLGALYEVSLNPAGTTTGNPADLDVQYRLPTWPVAQTRTIRLEGKVQDWTQTEPSFRFAAAWAEFGRILQGDRAQAGAELERLEGWVDRFLPDDTGGYRSELLENIVAARQAAAGDSGH